MQLIDFLDPVELEKPDEYFLKKQGLFSHCIEVQTDNSEIPDLSEFDLVLLGVPEDRNSYNKGSALSPNAIRSELYSLMGLEMNLKLIDLGNLKPGNTYTDTYFALREVISVLLGNNLNIILLGGTQDLTLPIFQSFEGYQEKINLACIDSKIDSDTQAIESNSESYLLEILLKKKKLFKFTNIGHQSYFTGKQSLELINTLFHDAIRLGDVRNNIKLIEPYLRDSDIVSFDMGAIRKADAPGYFRPTPNGFYAEEACQLSRYAGTSDKVRLFGIFECNQLKDIQNHSASLAAQMAWYFIDGLSCRYIEEPDANSNSYKTFIVAHNDLDYDMAFYKSMKTERWWLEVPNSKDDTKVVIACSHEDYLTACNHEVPDIWWKVFQKLG